MKKSIIILAIFLALLCPAISKADYQLPNGNWVLTPGPVVPTDQQLKLQLISLLKQLIAMLEQQLAAMIAQQNTLNQIVQNTTPSATPAPVQSPIQTIMPEDTLNLDLSIQSSVCNLASSNLKTEYNLADLLSNGNIDGAITMNAYVINKDLLNNYFNDNPTARMTITTSDGSNDKILQGSGNTGACGYFYPYEFYATKVGTYTIMFAIPELNLTKDVTITVQ